MTLRSLRVPAVILIGAVWTLAFLMGMLTRDYGALAITTPVVMVAAGAVFALKNGNGNGAKK